MAACLLHRVAIDPWVPGAKVAREGFTQGELGFGHLPLVAEYGVETEPIPGAADVRAGDRLASKGERGIRPPLRRSRPEASASEITHTPIKRVSPVLPKYKAISGSC